MRISTPLILLALFLGACQSGTPSGPASAEILTKAGAQLEATKTFHFSYKNEGGGAPILNGLTLNTAEGDFAKPDKLKVNLNANFGSSVVEVQFIGLGDVSYVSNPITKEWQKVPGGLSA